MLRPGIPLIVAGLMAGLVIGYSLAFAGPGGAFADGSKDNGSQKTHELRKSELDDNLRLLLGKTSIAACFFDCPRAVKFLLDHGADVNAKSLLGITPLIAASERDHQDVVQLLLDRGAETNAKKVISGRTALMCACQWGYLGVVKRLLEKGADVNARDKDGWTALMIASINGYTDIFKLLKAHGAKEKKVSPSPLTKEYGKDQNPSGE